MDSEEIFFYYMLGSGLLLALGSFHHAYKVQKNRGFVFESELYFIIFLLVSLFQQVITAPVHLEGISKVLLTGIFLAIFITLLCVKFYFIGRKYTVYEINKSKIVGMIQDGLDKLSIEYNEKEDVEAGKFKFILPNESAKIVVSWWDEDSKKYTVTFKKWWRITDYDLLLENIIENLNKERKDRFFKKQVILNIIGGICILLFFSYLAVRMAGLLFV
jgi:hypothetical protein